MDELLEMIRYDFVTKVYPEISRKGGVFMTLPTTFNSNFDLVLKKWEAKTKELSSKTTMRSFTQTKKGQKVQDK